MSVGSEILVVDEATECHLCFVLNSVSMLNLRNNRLQRETLIEVY